MKYTITIRDWSKRICHGGLLVISIGVNGHAYAQASEAELIEFAGQVAQYVMTQQYGTLSQMHHLPVASANRSVANESLCQLENSLRDIAGEFGELQQLRPLNDPAMFFGLGSGGGNQDYWQTQPEAYTFTYIAQYKNAGEGILKFEVVDIKGQPELKAINFGLYPSESALEKLQEIAAAVAESRRQRDANHACFSLLKS